MIFPPRTTLLLIVALSIIIFAGCSEDPSVPEETPPPSLNSGLSSAEWWIEDPSCEADDFCLEYVAVFHQRDDDPTLQVRVSGSLGTISQTATISIDDFDSFKELAERVVSRHSGEFEECSLNEHIGTFAGDAGFSVAIGECDDTEVQQVRELAADLVGKYFQP